MAPLCLLKFIKNSTNLFVISASIWERQMSCQHRLPPLNHSGSENRTIRGRWVCVHTINPARSLWMTKTDMETAWFFCTGSAGCQQPHMEVLDSDFPMCSCAKYHYTLVDFSPLKILVHYKWEEAAPKTDQHQLLLLINSASVSTLLTKTARSTSKSRGTESWSNIPAFH